MEVESQQRQQPPTENQISKHLRWFLMALNFTIMVIGTAVSPLLLRLYFLKGGNRKWLSSWLQTGGWPLLFIPLAISYAHRRRGCGPTKLYLMTPPVFLACTVVGLLFGIDDFLYAYGMSYLPVSTSSILLSTQVGFTALFAFFAVRHFPYPKTVTMHQIEGKRKGMMLSLLKRNEKILQKNSTVRKPF